MCLIGVPNLTKISSRKGCFFLAQSYCFKLVWRRRKIWKIWRISGNFQKWIFQKLLSRFSLNCMYMEGIKYISLIEISLVVIKIYMRCWKRWLSVPVNNTLACRMSFLATDTRPCVFMCTSVYCIVTVIRKLVQFYYCRHYSIGCRITTI